MTEEDKLSKINESPEAGVEPKAEDTQRKRIEELLDEGYTPVQIEKEWGFPHSTVRKYARKKITPRGKGKEEGNSEGDIPMLPMVLKAGVGQEVISPEGILRYYFLSDGDAGAWMLKGMMLLRAAQLMNLTDVEIMKGQADAQARAIKPVLDVMEQARRDMDAAAQRARESNAEIAEAAAAGAAARAVMRIDEKFSELKQQKPDIAQAPDPMKGLMARTMETIMNQLTGQMLGGQAGPVPGLVDKRG